MITFDSTGDAEDAILADTLCKSIGATLLKHYPKRQWYVDVSIKGGIVKIMSPSISLRFGFVIHLDKALHDLEREVLLAGGQILEMFKLSRDRDAQGGEEILLRDARGEVLSARTGL